MTSIRTVYFPLSSSFVKLASRDHKRFDCMQGDSFHFALDLAFCGRLSFWKFEFSKMAEVEARQIAILETVEDIQNRREQVLRRYAEFKEATRLRRQRLEDAKRYHQFKRDADEVEAWINEKLQIACDENYKDPTNLQVRFCGINCDL